MEQINPNFYKKTTIQFLNRTKYRVNLYSHKKKKTFNGKTNKLFTMLRTYFKTDDKYISRWGGYR